jgi:DNA-binding NtrC family response regulator
MTPPHVAVVDDHPAILEALRLLLEPAGYRVTTLSHPGGLHELFDLDLVLLDMNFSRDTTSGTEGLEAMSQLAELRPDVPVILLTGWGTLELAVEAMKLGARDFLTKPWDNRRLLAACHAQCELRQAQTARRSTLVDAVKVRGELDARYDFSAIVGCSTPLVNALHMVADVAPTSATVLITGPAGTGKELIAQAIHRNSPRVRRPFMAVHIGALAEGLFERELFGHVKGAFTDAREDKPGRFAAANGGTLFLDEIGTLKKDQQLKLLRVLQEGEFEPLGSTRTQKVDVRVVAATNADLQVELAAGRFREDLYYRLQVVELYLPALARRPEDILPCATHFLRQHVAKTGKAISGFTPTAERALLAHAWPGNIRELENVIERAVIFGRSSTIDASDLPFQHPGASAAPVAPASLSEQERASIARVLEGCAGNISKAAAALGLSRAALYRRMAKYALG